MTREQIDQAARELLFRLQQIERTEGGYMIECDRCKGKGYVDLIQDGMPGQEHCPECGGHGDVWDEDAEFADEVAAVVAAITRAVGRERERCAEMVPFIVEVLAHGVPEEGASAESLSAQRSILARYDELKRALSFREAMKLAREEWLVAAIREEPT